MSSLVHDRYAIACKDNNGKTIEHVPRYGRSKGLSSISTVKVWKWRWMVKVKRRYSKDLQQGGGLEIPCKFFVSSEHKKMLHRFEEYDKDVLSKKWKQN